MRKPVSTVKMEAGIPVRVNVRLPNPATAVIDGQLLCESFFDVHCSPKVARKLSSVKYQFEIPGAWRSPDPAVLGWLQEAPCRAPLKLPRCLRTRRIRCP